MNPVRFVLSVPARVLPALGLALALTAGNAWAQKVVAVTQIVDHPALDAVRKGLVEGLAELGFADGKAIRIEYQSAQGSPVTALQIGKKFAGDEPAAIVAISTPSAQSVVAANKKVPVVFAAVTDAITTKLVASLERPGANVTGVLAFPPVHKQLDLLQALVPGAKRVGVIYNAGEANSVAILAEVRKQIVPRGLTLQETTITKSSEVGAAAEFLVGKVDTVLVAGDNTVTTALESLIRVTQENKLAVVCGDPLSVKRGCTAGVGYDWLAVGKKAAAIVARILKGEDPGTIAVTSADTIELAINAKSAEAMRLSIPDALLRSANSVVR